MREKLTEEERIEHQKEINRRKKAKSRAKGNEVSKSVVLTKSDANELQIILDSYGDTFPQFVRKIISGEYKIVSIYNE